MSTCAQCPLPASQGPASQGGAAPAALLTSRGSWGAEPPVLFLPLPNPACLHCGGTRTRPSRGPPARSPLPQAGSPGHAPRGRGPGPEPRARARPPPHTHLRLLPGPGGRPARPRRLRSCGSMVRGGSWGPRGDAGPRRAAAARGKQGAAGGAGTIPPPFPGRARLPGPGFPTQALGAGQGHAPGRCRGLGSFGGGAWGGGPPLGFPRRRVPRGCTWATGEGRASLPGRRRRRSLGGNGLGRVRVPGPGRAFGGLEPPGRAPSTLCPSPFPTVKVRTRDAVFLRPPTPTPPAPRPPLSFLARLQQRPPEAAPVTGPQPRAAPQAPGPGPQ